MPLKSKRLPDPPPNTYSLRDLNAMVAADELDENSRRIKAVELPIQEVFDFMVLATALGFGVDLKGEVITATLEGGILRFYLQDETFPVIPEDAPIPVFSDVRHPHRRRR